MWLYGGIIASAHVCAAIWALRQRGAASSRRQLALVFIATLPVIGVVMAVVSLRARGINNSPALNQPVPDVSRRHAAEADLAPLLERLIGTSPERRAALASMSRADGAQKIGGLRWLIERGDGEAALDAALTLEELADRRLADVARLTERAGEGVDWRRMVDAADLIADTVHSGIADPSMVPALCARARELYRAAYANVAGQPAELTESWARLELTAMRPTHALMILEETDPPADEARARSLGRLRTDALFAARERSHVFG